MKKTTKQKLLDAKLYCEQNDKSTEFMVRFMQDYAEVSYDCVIDFLTSQKEGLK